MSVTTVTCIIGNQTKMFSWSAVFGHSDIFLPTDFHTLCQFSFGHTWMLNKQKVLYWKLLIDWLIDFAVGFFSHTDPSVCS